MLVFGFAMLQQIVFAQTPLVVEFRWVIAHHCSATSPRIKVTRIPPGTRSLQVKMIDLDSRNPEHGGGSGKVVSDSDFPSVYQIPAGALENYKGPCPDNFTTLGHEYQIQVDAIGQDQQLLSQGSAKAPFSGKFVILQGVIGQPAD